MDEETGIVKIRTWLRPRRWSHSQSDQRAGSSPAGSLWGSRPHERSQFEDGRVINPSFMDYKLPSAQEIPEIVADPVEVPLPEGPFGAKGIGELAVVGMPRRGQRDLRRAEMPH